MLAPGNLDRRRRRPELSAGARPDQGRSRREDPEAAGLRPDRHARRPDLRRSGLLERPRAGMVEDLRPHPEGLLSPSRNCRHPAHDRVPASDVSNLTGNWNRERRHPDRYRQALRRLHRRAPHVAGHRRGRLRHAARAFGLRQDDDAAHDRRPARPERGRDRHQGQARQRRADPQAQSRPRVPELRAVSAQDRGRERRLRPEIPQCAARPTRGARSGEALDLVQLPDVGERYPKELSGGQQQRIALARAIVIEPDVLLLDEPLSALDANLREDMRVELKRIQHRIGVTTVFVTHDQSEALAMSDQIIVMSAGRVEQVGRARGGLQHAGKRIRRPLPRRLQHPARRCTGLRRRRNRAGDAAVSARLAIPADRGPRIGEHGTRPSSSSGRKSCISQSPTHAAERRASCRATVETVDYQGQAARYFVRVGDLQLQAINMIDEHPFARGPKCRVRSAPARLRRSAGKLT